MTFPCAAHRHDVLTRSAQARRAHEAHLAAQARRAHEVGAVMTSGISYEGDEVGAVMTSGIS
eukprot:7466820-Pyramimonas_sp.AAC.1